ncbi:hypothetical protein K8I28_01225, partial [bacterium]|nr:hypothetical protein [bacterium]
MRYLFSLLILSILLSTTASAAQRIHVLLSENSSDELFANYANLKSIHSLKYQNQELDNDRLARWRIK